MILEQLDKFAVRAGKEDYADASENIGIGRLFGHEAVDALCLKLLNGLVYIIHIEAKMLTYAGFGNEHILMTRAYKLNGSFAVKNHMSKILGSAFA